MRIIGNDFFFFFRRNTLYTLSMELMNVILFPILRTVLHLFSKGNLIAVIFFQSRKYSIVLEAEVWLLFVQLFQMVTEAFVQNIRYYGLEVSTIGCPNP